MYWDTDVYIENSGIQSIFTRDRYKEILQNLHFADNAETDKEDKGYKIRPITDHLNKAFCEECSDNPEKQLHYRLDRKSKFRFY